MMGDVATRQLLGGADAATFLRRHWQKKPLLVRQAIGGFRGLLSPPELFTLAGRDDVEARLVTRTRGRWTLAYGPFRTAELKRLPARNWTLLVQGLNFHLASADALLRRFAFIPYARLDDVMVSYAAPGGGVGPHVDSYDVFLLQGEGRRRWRLSRPLGSRTGSRTGSRHSEPRDAQYDPSLPVRILTRFQPESEHLVDAGDMLYLPPRYAHEGVAVDACTTYSIGFRAPSAQDLGTAFLDWLRDSIALEGRYGDPTLAPAREPARISRAMHQRSFAMLAGIRWNGAAVGRFLGCFLSEPKPNVFFDRPSRKLGLAAFRAGAARRGLSLDRRTQLLYDNRDVFLNGTVVDCAGSDTAVIRRLANARHLSGAEISRAGSSVMALFYRWFGDGFLHFD